MKPISIIGTGVSPEDLTDSHRKIIKKAHIIIGGKRNLSFFNDTPALKKEIGKDMVKIISYIRLNMQNKNIVVLASGDPLFYGIGSLLVKALTPDYVKIYPNISSLSVAFAKIKMPWSNAHTISLHGRDNVSTLIDLVKTPKSNRPIAIFTDPKRNPAWLADLLISKDLLNIKMYVFEKLGSCDESYGEYNLEKAREIKFSDPNIVILMQKKKTFSSNLPLYMGMAEEVFEHDKGMITKSEIRAVVLSKLQLLPSNIFWDLGAGSGSISIEASIFLKKGKIFALEKKSQRIENIRSNINNLKAKNIEVIQADLPDGLSHLPRPDRVFIGGGGKNLKKIIKAVTLRLNPKGIIVINTVLFANLEISLDILRKYGFKTNVVQIQVNRSKNMPWSERFDAQNPVWIISGKKMMKSS